MLSPKERALWDLVTATIRPLSREPRNAPAERPSDPQTLPVAARPKGAPPRRPAPPSPRPPAFGTTLDGSWDRKLAGGAVQPDRTLDLHGHTLDSAWGALDRALDHAIDAGDRVLLLITGHARPGDPPIQRGRIRAAVHDWLAASRHAGRIAAVRGAHRRHGGGGSLYIVLRRR